MRDSSRSFDAVVLPPPQADLVQYVPWSSVNDSQFHPLTDLLSFLLSSSFNCHSQRDSLIDKHCCDLYSK